MPAFTTAQGALAQAGIISDEQTSLLKELAMMKAQELQLRRDAFEGAAARGENVTTCREIAQYSTTNLMAEIVRLQGDIEANIVELAHCDRFLNYCTFKP